MSLDREPLGQLLADRYQIEREVGRGGSATVYLARDLKHHRRVALKIFNPKLAAALGPDRFLREIEIVSQLNHPHVLPLHDSGHSDGLLYYVMPYVEGESLRDRLQAHQQLPVLEVLQLTREIADGLAYAHGLGIVHRDIKPENILLSGGHAVIADFGIAHALSAAGGSHLTTAGIIVGSPIYMSPEQARGESNLDERSDVYSLGCVVYEMLAGEPPITGPNVQTVLARKSAGEIPSLSVVRKSVPAGMEAVLVKALALLPADRYATVRGFAEALGRTVERRRGLRAKHLVLVAVVIGVGGFALARLVPWKDRNEAAQVGAIASSGGLRIGILPPELGGVSLTLLPQARLIQQMLAADLTRYRGLAVVDPLSLNSRLLGVGDKPVPDPIGSLRKWSVPYAVRITLASTPAGLDVSYTLTSTPQGEVVETGSFTNTHDDSLAIQIQQTGNRLWQALETAHGGITKALDLQPFLARAPDAAALRAFLQGAEYSYRQLPGGREHFERALQIDPDFIAPRVWLVSGLLSAGDTAAANAHIRVLQSLEPKATPFEQALIGWAEAKARADLEATVRHLRVALAYSPHNNILLWNLGYTLLGLGRPDEAVAPVREAMESGWRFAPLYTLWGVVAIEVGQLDGLRDTLEAAQAITPPDPYIAGLLESLAVFTGDSGAARRQEATFREQMGPGHVAEGLSEMARIYRSLAQRAREQGDPKRAVLLLQHAMDDARSAPLLRLELARALTEAGQRQRAEAQFQIVVKEGVGDSAVTIALMGEVAMLLEHKDEARFYLQRYLEISPEGPQAAQTRAWLRTLTTSQQRQ